MVILSTKIVPKKKNTDIQIMYIKSLDTYKLSFLGLQQSVIFLGQISNNN